MIKYKCNKCGLESREELTEHGNMKIEGWNKPASSTKCSGEMIEVEE